MIFSFFSFFKQQSKEGTGRGVEPRDLDRGAMGIVPKYVLGNRGDFVGGFGRGALTFFFSCKPTLGPVLRCLAVGVRDYFFSLPRLTEQQSLGPEQASRYGSLCFVWPLLVFGLRHLELSSWSWDIHLVIILTITLQSLTNKKKKRILTGPLEPTNNRHQRLE